MDEIATLSSAFARTAAALSVLLSDRLKTEDPAAHAQLEAALCAGHHVALSLVTGVAGGACIQLDLVNGAGERCTVMTLNARGGTCH